MSIGFDRVEVSYHFKKQMREKGFSFEQVLSALTSPEKITDVMRYPGQKRYCGAGVAIIVDNRFGVHTLVTLYADGIVTPLRRDQMNDPEAIASKRLNRK